MHQKELECREMFLKVFPQLKVQLEELIAQLHQLADKADQVHKDCTIANVVADSTGVVSGAMTILGLILVPFTAGGSMLLTGAGLGLGALSAGTSVTSNIVENENMSSLEAEANKLEARGFNIQTLIKEVMEALRESASEVGLAKTSIGVVYHVARHVRAIRVLHNNLSAAARVSVRNSRLLDLVLGPTGKLMGKGARAVGGLFTAVFLVQDAVNLAQESKDLQQGAKSELGKELRQKAQELEKMLRELNDIYQNLQ
ncbi:apolipoprotein L3-like [Talpa occidentalis]|uniref:apolipoprotein L3-like n=1 Tax=Talpa occidentalis TaxID=50954 RepID=UPI0023FA4A34|nr:apolipoprotein L3-like [Talpa occidentalis]